MSAHLARALSNLRYVKRIDNKCDSIFRYTAFNTSNVFAVKGLTTKPNNVVKNKESKSSPIYFMKEIRFISALNASKVPIGIASIVFIPLAYVAEMSRILPEYTAAGFLTASFSLCSSIMLSSFLFNRTVGIVKYNEENDIVTVSSIDIMGRKIDEEFPLKDIVPLSETPYTFKDFYFPLIILGCGHKKKFFYNKKYILDEKKFEKVLGKIKR